MSKKKWNKDMSKKNKIKKNEEERDEAYQESRWGLQAMETMQKIVESGTVLNQRVRHEVISYPLSFWYLFK